MTASNSGSSGKIPGPYVHDVKRDDGMMEYTTFDAMGIGARRSGMPAGEVSGIKSLEHVGSSDGKRGTPPQRTGG